MNNNKNRLSIAVALGLLGSVASSNTMAAGFQLAEYSATGLGRAYAGEAAIADGADAQWRNVAMLTYLEGTQISVGGIYVNPNIDVEGQSSMSPTSTKSEDFAHDAFIPNLYVSHRVNQQLAIGFAVGTNYGMETDLGTDFTGTNFGNEASVITKEINVNMAYQINQQFSIGGGVRYVIAEGSFGAVAPTQTPTFHPSLPKPGTTLKYMEGTDEAWGWQVGTAWQINDTNRIGFNYKSEVKLDLTGHANGVGFDLYAQNPSDRYSGSMELALPATAELASFHQLNDKLAIHASFNWTDWSSFEKLEANIPSLKVATQEIKQENWEDNYRLAVGGTYALDQKVTLRTGIAYDTSAVSEENRTATIPETDRLWLSMGAGYAWSDNLTLDAGFTYIFAKDAKMHEKDPKSAPFGGTFEGETTGNVWLVGVQANYRF
ncbi:outer membrane protein transport protein [Aliivibrio fischeri]|uniref:outer membrane protein transport protein n=1 Tax=Aliivibrio fischeri TaxID=668 RepID=UPI0012DA6E3B|nr:outer membrane protein transport protein [Aliivibrio fischeri]MUJ29950.1 aromatic hydrocarbon degradation protein [Aliivibrio fischeri]MUK65837.1 aromatic hydrocarbon degradation protein [Aliivibrio fischeri]MUL18319.1 aromatic hydrocarbon degradation protein [Aliivibrio fischeri]